jgi:hypothetical protein
MLMPSIMPHSRTDRQTKFRRNPTPFNTAKDAKGREHHAQAFNCWMAGGGVRGGHAHGETDEFGNTIISDNVHVHDLHATILQLLGLDHTRLTYRHAGRDYQLTDVYGTVVKWIVA